MKRKTVIALLATMSLTAGVATTGFAANFSDVTKGTPIDTYVTDVTDKGLMEGETDTEFGVAEGTTRSDLVQALYQLNLNLPVTGSHEFTDIAGREDAAAIEWADDVGLFDELNENFFQDNKFEPDKELTREEAAQILYSFAQKVDKMDMSKGVGSLEGYTDSAEATVTYADAMKWVLGNKIFTGDDLNTDDAENAIRPTTAISRAETAQALSVYMTMRGNTQDEVQQVTNTITNKNNTTAQAPSKNEGNQAPSQGVSTPDKNEEQKPSTPSTGGDVTDPGNPEQPTNPGGGDVTDPEDPEKPTDPGDGDVTEPEDPAHEHSWGDAYYVVDQEATEDSKEWVVDKPAEYEQVWVVDKPAEYEQNWVVDKPAEYEQIKVVDKEAWTEEVKELHTICFLCRDQGTTTIMDGWDDGQIVSHCKENHGGACHYGNAEIVVDTIYHPEEFHYEQGALISPEQGHWEQGALISPEQGHYENGDLISPEEGHWETIPGLPELGHWEHECSECGEIENCEEPEA